MTWPRTAYLHIVFWSVWPPDDPEPPHVARDRPARDVGPRRTCAAFHLLRTDARPSELARFWRSLLPRELRGRRSRTGGQPPEGPGSAGWCGAWPRGSVAQGRLPEPAPPLHEGLHGRTESGAFATSAAARAVHDSSSSSVGTTRFASPRVAAVSAPTAAPVKSSSFVLGGADRSTSFQVSVTGTARPMAGEWHGETASSAATRMSQWSASSHPRRRHRPGRLRGPVTSPRYLFEDRAARLPRPPRSASPAFALRGHLGQVEPAQNAGPFARRMTTRTSGSARHPAEGRAEMGDHVAVQRVRLSDG